ncbi:MAG: cobalamin-dependent protein [Endomicrobia bacterium]|nr:cobalamin-dependent protein [Endomicrobiia bacterium]
MAKILLVSLNTYEYPYPVYPAGMSAVSAALKRAKHEVLQYDCMFPEKTIEQTVKDFNPDIAGISVRNIDNEDSLSADSRWSGDKAKNIVSAVKSAKNIPVFLGGAGFSVAAKEFLDYTKADFGVVGAGEVPVTNLIEDILNANIRGRIYSSNQVSYIEPDIEQKLLRKYSDAGGILGVNTKRGCAYSCAYCSYPLIDGKFFSGFDAAATVKYIKRLENEYGVKEIFFTDSVFNDSSGFARTLCEEMIRQKTKIRFAAYFNPANGSKRDMELFRRAGLFAAECGSDAASAETLKALNKPFTFKEVEDFQNMCDEMKIPCAHFVIFGGPGESEESVDEGLENLKKLENGVVMVFSGIRVHYGTRIHEMALAEGKIGKSASLLKPFYYFSDKIDADAMNKKIERSFRGNRKRIFPPEKGEEMMKTLRRFGYKGLLWDTLVKAE